MKSPEDLSMNSGVSHQIYVGSVDQLNSCDTQGHLSIHCERVSGFYVLLLKTVWFLLLLFGERQAALDVVRHSFSRQIFLFIYFPVDSFANLSDILAHVHGNSKTQRQRMNSCPDRFCELVIM